MTIKGDMHARRYLITRTVFHFHFALSKANFVCGNFVFGGVGDFSFMWNKTALLGSTCSELSLARHCLRFM